MIFAGWCSTTVTVSSHTHLIKEDTPLTRYHLLQRILHWLIAIIVFGMLTSGMAFMLLGDEGVGSLVKVHMTFGVMLFILMLIRIALRVLLPTPVYEPEPDKLPALVAKVIHLLLYVLLLGLPLGGWLATSAAGETVHFFNLALPALMEATEESKILAKTLFTMHGLGGITVLLLVLIHTAAAIKEWRTPNSTMMRRISLP
jgi:cytochrome b561